MRQMCNKRLIDLVNLIDQYILLAELVLLIYVFVNSVLGRGRGG